jgi:hypothetical protein
LLLVSLLDGLHIVEGL